MQIDVESGWWKTLFDDIYLVTDARSVGDEVLTRREVGLLCDLIPLRPGHKVLDLCGGQGRHSFDLCRRGFSDCTVFDYSSTLLKIGARRSRRLNCTIEFVQGDARHMQLSTARFDHVLLLGNSLGYAGDAGDDLKILQEAHRVLDRSGWIAIDVTDGHVVRRQFNPNAWHEIGEDIVVCRQRQLQDNRVCARELVIDKRSGVVRDRTYAMRLYDGPSLQTLVSEAGFDKVHLHKDFSAHRSDGDVGFMNHRMIVTAQKTA